MRRQRSRLRTWREIKKHLQDPSPGYDEPSLDTSGALLMVGIWNGTSRFSSRCLLGCAIVLFATGAGAAVTIQPVAPTSNDLIIASIDVPGGCGVTSSTARTLNVVRTDVHIADCSIGPPPFTVIYQEQFGPLPPGPSIYQVYFTYESGPPELESQQTIVVAAAPSVGVPAVGPLGYAMLGVLLAGAALVALRRV
jgi:hypothetical protein